MQAYAKSKTPAGDGDKRQTPWDVFIRIQEVVGFDFNVDVAAEARTAKTTLHWTEEQDSLNREHWAHDARLIADVNIPVLWMNPPYSEPEMPCKTKCSKKRCVERGHHITERKAGMIDWVQKAHEESKKGCIVVGLLPDDRSTDWYQNWVEDKAAIIYVPDKRISFEDGNGVPQKGNPKGSVFPVWMPMYVDKSNYVRFKL